MNPEFAAELRNPRGFYTDEQRRAVARACSETYWATRRVSDDDSWEHVRQPVRTPLRDSQRARRLLRWLSQGNDDLLSWLAGEEEIEDNEDDYDEI